MATKSFSIQDVGYICDGSIPFFLRSNPHPVPSCSDQVRWVAEILKGDKVLLDAPCAHEPVENADAACLVVRAARARTAEGLLPDDGTRALLVVVHVAGGVAELVRGEDERSAVGGEAGGVVRERLGDACTYT